MKIEIKHRWKGSILFSLETESLKLCVEAAVKSNANLRGAYLEGAYLGGANLRGAYLEGAYLRGANLEGAYLGGAYLRGAYLEGANLEGAYLGGANLRGAYLEGANLRGAYLEGAYLGGANLRGAYLEGAYLRGAYLEGAKGINKHKCTPLTILLDQPGKIRAYKLVNADFVGPYSGGIKYEVGKTVSVDNANTDDTQHCAAGINIATLDWCMMNWKEGFHILIVEFTAKDIAAIPIATDGKFRVHRCKVVAEKNLKEIGLIS